LGCRGRHGTREGDSRDQTGHTAGRDDRASLPVLVNLLESNDATIRARSVAVLRAMTGQKIEFLPYDEPADRATGRKQWEQWVASVGAKAKLTYPRPSRRRPPPAQRPHPGRPAAF
jgi:hypothetical protein